MRPTIASKMQHGDVRRVTAPAALCASVIEPVPNRGSGTRRAWLRFYGGLNDHLPESARQRAVAMRFDVPPTVKAAVEAFGIPHVEVGLLIRAGQSLQFSDRIAPEDRIAVYPWFATLDVSTAEVVSATSPRPTRFVTDTHLHKLCRLLRLAGIDTESARRGADLAVESVSHRRILLTRNRRLLMRSDLQFGYWVRSTAPITQMTEVMQRFDLAGHMHPLRRCSICNGLLACVAKEQVASQLPPKTALWLDEYMRCERCGKLYWRGTHAERIAEVIAQCVAACSNATIVKRGGT